MATTVAATTPLNPDQPDNLGREDRTLLLFARLMEGGREDDETCRDLSSLTTLFTQDVDAIKHGEPSITRVIDRDCFDTIVCYLDMRQPEIVRGHATLTVSAYLKAAGDEGSQNLADFFQCRVRRGTYDDYIVAFCVAAAIFPVVPAVVAELFLSEGFLPSLGLLMRRKWKSRKVETACLDMLNAACINASCRDAVQKYCSEWLEEIVDLDPEEVVRDMSLAADPDVQIQEGSISMRKHSEHVQNLAAVVLAKLRAAPTAPSRNDTGTGPRVQEAATSIEDLSKMLTKMLIKDPDNSAQNSIEGLAYASLQPKVKEELAHSPHVLAALVKMLEKAPPKSPVTYGVLSILVHMTRYRPALSEEEHRMNQLKAYANAAGKVQHHPLDDDDYVAERCKRVFESGFLPVLVSHCRNGSPASLALIVSIVYSLSALAPIRGQLAQQGAVRLLMAAWTALPATDGQARRSAAQALARILISTNPSHVFGGTHPIAQTNAIRPLISLLQPDPDVEMRHLLPVFETLMALTNLASTDDDTRCGILRAAWNDVEEHLLSSNARVATAAAELVCNLVQAPKAVVMFADGSAKARNRLHVLVALADAEHADSRSAAGGALATLTNYESCVRGILSFERGVTIILGLCADDNEAIRHRGAFTVLNMASAEGEDGRDARARFRDENGVALLTECAKKSRSPDVVELTVQALKLLLHEP